MTRPARPFSVFGRFRRDQSGVSAVEFAILAPVMIGIWFGLAEFCQGFMAQKRMGHATAQVADIIAQSTVVSRDDIESVFAIGALIMEPFPAEPFQVQVSSVTRGNDGVARVNWSRAQGMTALGVNSVVSVPDGMINNGESVIMSRATYTYQSPVGDLLPDTTRFEQTFFLRPRLVERIDCSDC